MSCYNPNLMSCRKDLDTGKLNFSFHGSGKYIKPCQLGSFFDLKDNNDFSFLVPCGKCVGCRIDYVRDWSSRMIFELVDNDNIALFVTLTYNNEHLHHTLEGPSLDKRDIQLFFKRLRSRFSNRRIRYYIAGEYGPRTGRPHYHAIIYGLCLDDFPDIVQVGMNELRQPYYSSPIFADIWQNGFVQMSSVNYSTCAYVARYVTKKHYGAELQDFHYKIPEFNLSSRSPGIGLGSAVSVVLSGDFYHYFSFSDGPRKVATPRSFYRHLKRNLDLIPPDKQEDFVRLCVQRSKDSNDRLNSNFLFFGLPFPDYLKKNCNNLVSKLRLLPERK